LHFHGFHDQQPLVLSNELSDINRERSVRLRITHGQKFNDQNFPGLDLDSDLFPGFQPVRNCAVDRTSHTGVV